MDTVLFLGSMISHINNTFVLSCFGEAIIILPTSSSFRDNIAINIVANFASTFLILVLNLPMLYIMLSQRKYRTPSYTLVLSNVITDLILGVLLGIWNIILVIAFQQKDPSCSVVAPIVAFTTVSGNALAIQGNYLAADRYISIFKPFVYHSRIALNNRIYLLPIIGAWFFSLITVVVSLFEPICKIVFFAIIFLLTCFWCCFVYVKIFFLVRAKKLEKKRHSLGIPTPIITTHYKKKDVKLFVLTIAVLIAFFICYGPFNVTLVIVLVTEHNNLSNDVVIALFWCKTLYHLKGVINPLIYCYSMLEMRRDLLACITRKITPINDTSVPNRGDITNHAQSNVP